MNNKQVSTKGVLWKWTNYWNGPSSQILNWYMDKLLATCSAGHSTWNNYVLWLAVCPCEDGPEEKAKKLNFVTRVDTRTHRWQPRWFILDDGILSYYQSEDEVKQGCKGSVCVAACDINVHHTDLLRLDIVIQGEQHIYVRAASSGERQLWLVALGSAKAQGLITRSKRPPELATTPDDVRAKKSELRLYCDLLMQQVHSIKEAANADPQPDVTKLDECTNMLTATCDTFIKTLDECVKIANASPSYSVSAPPQFPSLPVPTSNSVFKSGKVKSIIHSNSH